MEILVPRREITRDPVSSGLVEFLESHKSELNLNTAKLYYEFPIFRDEDSQLWISKLIITSPNHGIITIWSSNITGSSSEILNFSESEILKAEQIFYLIQSRLIRNMKLREIYPNIYSLITSVFYAPHLEIQERKKVKSTTVITTLHGFLEFIIEIEKEKKISLDDVSFNELRATVEGSKALIRPKEKRVYKEDVLSKGSAIDKLESLIATFDSEQMLSYMRDVHGPQRIRGLAGSGKTVVLAIKAAMIHLLHPDATIVYTYYTKSLYQLVKRLITRFYRQYSDTDPNWKKLKVWHAWGGITVHGLYYDICLVHEYKPLTFKEASYQSKKDAFDYICKDLLFNADLKPIYDYILIDEGQDFPPSFLKVCTKVARNNRFVWAYDDLQTIFQPTAPTPGEVFGLDEHGRSKIDLEYDIVLHKCYRNPREILVCAHALGFGLYSNEIIQMLENKEHWKDIGYEIVEGELTAESEVKILRPKENSLTLISDLFQKEDIVKAYWFETFEEEIDYVINQIESNINNDNLKPDDILVIVVDDRQARNYLTSISEKLREKKIETHNIHSDNYGLRTFIKEDCVTLSTVHKAKGNESYFVYVVGVDALFVPTPDIRKRNILFSAMTRAKAWVRVSGLGLPAKNCQDEINRAIENSPNLKFRYPDPSALEIIRRDLKDRAIKQKITERRLDEILKTYTPEEIKQFLDQRTLKKD